MPFGRTDGAGLARQRADSAVKARRYSVLGNVLVSTGSVLWDLWKVSLVPAGARDSPGGPRGAERTPKRGRSADRSRGRRSTLKPARDPNPAPADASAWFPRRVGAGRCGDGTGSRSALRGQLQHSRTDGIEHGELAKLERREALLRLGARALPSRSRRADPAAARGLTSPRRRHQRRRRCSRRRCRHRRRTYAALECYR